MQIDIPNATADPVEVRAQLEEYGLAIVPDLLPEAQREALRARLVEQAAAELAAGVGKGGSPPVQFVWGLIHKGQVFRELVLNPVALDYVRHVLGDDLLLFGLAGNAIGPGGKAAEPTRTSSTCR